LRYAGIEVTCPTCSHSRIRPVAELLLEAGDDAQSKTAVDAEMRVVEQLGYVLPSSEPLSTPWMPPSSTGLTWAVSSTGSIREPGIARWRW
jgi:hypothetical protein